MAVMKKALYMIASGFEAALLIGAYVIQYFTRRKMGMARYVVYKNRGWEAKYPMELLQYAAMAAVLILTVLAVAGYVRLHRKPSIRMKGMVLVTVFLAVLYIGFTLMSGTDRLRAYYFIDGMFAAAALVQGIKANLGLYAGRTGRRSAE